MSARRSSLHMSICPKNTEFSHSARLRFLTTARPWSNVAWGMDRMRPSHHLMASPLGCRGLTIGTHSLNRGSTSGRSLISTSYLLSKSFQQNHEGLCSKQGCIQEGRHTPGCSRCGQGVCMPLLIRWTLVNPSRRPIGRALTRALTHRGFLGHDHKEKRC